MKDKQTREERIRAAAQAEIDELLKDQPEQDTDIQLTVTEANEVVDQYSQRDKKQLEQIEGLISDVNNLEEEKAKLTEKVAALETENKTLHKSLADAKKKIEALVVPDETGSKE